MTPFPRRGDIYFVDFDPTRGSEQGGIRPALIVSNDIANQYGAVLTVVAVTRTVPRKQYPQNVPLAAGPLPQPGTVFCGQLLTISKDRLKNYAGRVDADTLAAVNNALKAHLGI